MTEETPAKPASELVATNGKSPAAPSGSAVDVYFDADHEGVTGTELVKQGRPQLFKLDHKKGFYHPLDDDAERYDEIVGVIIAARSYYGRFGASGIACESDNGKEGFDKDLRKLIPCTAKDGGGAYLCPYSYEIEGTLQGKCSLRLQVQMIAVFDGRPTPIQLGMSASSAYAFGQYLNKLKRLKKGVRDVTTRVTKRFIKGQNPYYAGKFEMKDPSPCIDISSLIPKEGPSEQV